MKNLRLPIALTAAAVALTLAMGSAIPANAAGGKTFAQFFQAKSGAPFTFTNVGGSSPFGIFKTTTIPVTFEFLKSTSYGAAGTPISATLQFLAVTNGSATGSSLLDQPMGQVSMLFDTPGKSPVNLLTVTSNSASLTGFAGGNTGNLSADSSLGNQVIYSSQVLTGLGSKGGNYDLGFSSLQPSFMEASDGILESFKASGTGTFAAPVPEASTMVSFGILLLGGVLMVVARRKRTADSLV